MKCLACGSESLVGGTVFDSNGSKLNFKLDDAPVWKSLFGVGTRGSPVLSIGSIPMMRTHNARYPTSRHQLHTLYAFGIQAIFFGSFA
jgi:hypothetical protein